MEGNASVYRVNPGSRISGEGRAEFLSTWGPDFDQKGGVIYSLLVYISKPFPGGIDIYIYIFLWAIRMIGTRC